MIKDPKSGSNKYLLVESARIPDTYQPPGGVFKMHDDSYIKELEAIPDDDFHEKLDFRFKLKRKKIPELLKKFDSRRSREISIQREFHEELVQTKILPQELFPWVNSSYLKTHTFFGYSDHFKIDEFKLFEIYDIVLSEEQERHILELLNQASNKYVFADADTIDKRGYDRGSTIQELKIRPHTKLLIS